VFVVCSRRRYASRKEKRCRWYRRGDVSGRFGMHVAELKVGEGTFTNVVENRAECVASQRKLGAREIVRKKERKKKDRRAERKKDERSESDVLSCQHRV
jgi:hypothetical protein